MSSVSATTAPLVLPTTGIEKLKDQTPPGPEAAQARLRKATAEFESFFVYQMVKTMRKTIPKTGIAEGAPLSGDASKDIFTDLFDMHLARKMVKEDRHSISDLLYQFLEEAVQAQYGAPDSAVEIKPLRSNRAGSIELDRQHFTKIPRARDSYRIRAIRDEFMPVSGRIKPVRHDNIISRFGKHIHEASKSTSLDPALIVSVIKAESNGDPEAVSHAGAKGLMQLTDSVARDYGVREIFDPQANINAGSRYLKDLIDRFGSLRLALAAYNAGPSNVVRYDGVPPFKETESYVEKVLDTLKTINRTAASGRAKVKW